MPSMATSHGGMLYYVVQVPKGSEQQEERWTGTASHGYLEEAHSVVTSTPKQQDRSTDSGWDNPFRPDGDLSREADEIVELIKGGKPITPTPGGLNLSGGGASVPVSSAETAATVTTTATAASPANGSGPTKPAGPGAVELQRATVAPGDASQVEHVVLKKKPKCKCCVIQ